MAHCTQILDYLADFAPLELAEEWDNVGLLLGDRDQNVQSIMTCLTLTPDVAAEAIEKGIDLIISHHPILFRGTQRITGDTAEGKMLLELARHRVAVYSPHTAFDSAAVGINQQWCERLELRNVSPLQKAESEPFAAQGLGAGRFGQLKQSIPLVELLNMVKKRWQLEALQYVGMEDLEICRVAVACGSAAQFMEEAAQADCQVLITGEARFHACLEARQRGMALILVGHYASERFACERLAEIMREEFPEITVEPSSIEDDPLDWF